MNISNNSLGPDEWPKVTHGNTLVSDLSLVEVVEIINVRLLCYHNLMHGTIKFAVA